MVQDINEHADVKRLVRKRQMNAIEGNTWDGAVGAGSIFCAGDGEAGHGLAHNLRDGAISASYVKQRGGRGKHGREPLAKHSNSALMNQLPMRLAD